MSSVVDVASIGIKLQNAFLVCDGCTADEKTTTSSYTVHLYRRKIKIKYARFDSWFTSITIISLQPDVIVLLCCSRYYA